ncbi:flagellar basal body-associated FliL family protein [Cognatishimia maritima]|uniref:Flagellar protein FliL n=1 Tax=Cognatishimia maritima TaxID=870908 RepID=A0A1M5VX25_9RHOB|nr:flagellar basal body-associated FliL family protein [Cognatishimia maritima]SHH79757.1 Flagellar basal body-associated protein FliL [Cognatishimia maritima]
MAEDAENTGDSPDGGADAPKRKSSKLLLLAAVVLSLASLGGGFFLAQMAFQQDAKQYEPDYVEETEAPPEDGEDYAKAGGGKGSDDPYAEGDEKAKDGEEEVVDVDEGMLEFGEILTNITSVNAQGQPRNAFLKLTVVLVYRPDDGARALMESRQPFMRDLFNGYARSLTEADVRGMAGILNVKSELLKRARAAAGNDLPQEILISDLIVQ